MAVSDFEALILSTLSPAMFTVSLVSEVGDNETKLKAYENPHWQPFSVTYTAHVVFALLVTPVLLISFLGNGAVIYVFTKFKSLRTPSNILVVNLAISDLMMAATGYPLFIIASLKGSWIFGKIGCDFYGFTGALFGLMSINSLAAIAIERFWVIYRGMRINRAQLVTMVVIVWIVSILWAMFPLVGWSRYMLEAFQTSCSFDYFATDNWNKSFLMSVVVGDFFLPLIVICYCYIQILLKFKAHQKEYQTILNKDSQMSERESSSMCSSSVYSRVSRVKRSTDTVRSHLKEKFLKSKKVWSKTEYRIAKTVFLVIVVYVMSWTPYSVLCLKAQYGSAEDITPIAAMIPIFIAKLSTVYNPFIYAITHPKFKSAIRKTFPSLLYLCRRRITRRGPVTSHSNTGGIAIQMESFNSDSMASETGMTNNSQAFNMILEGEQIPTDFVLQLLKETAKKSPSGRITITIKGGGGPGKVSMAKKNKRGKSDLEVSDVM